MTLREVRRALPPADARLLRWALAGTMTGVGCAAVSLILAFTWVAMGGRGGALTAAHWLNWGAYGCLALVWACAILLWLRKRQRTR
jgi:hypothetical protein